MKRIEGEDIDYVLLQIERVFNEKQEKEKAREEWRKFFGFMIWIPEIFSLSEQETVRNIFWSDNRPDIIFFTDRKAEGVTLQVLGSTEMSGVDYESNPMEMIKHLLEKVDDRIVFYDMGVTEGNVNVHWIEYKSFAGEERVYNLLFLFQTEAGDVLGTFYCFFEEYEKWKPIAWEMIQSIREEPDEGI